MTEESLFVCYPRQLRRWESKHHVDNGHSVDAMFLHRRHDSDETNMSFPFFFS
jgi:hypothetical protein